MAVETSLTQETSYEPQKLSKYATEDSKVVKVAPPKNAHVVKKVSEDSSETNKSVSFSQETSPPAPENPNAPSNPEDQIKNMMNLYNQKIQELGVLERHVGEAEECSFQCLKKAFRLAKNYPSSDETRMSENEYEESRDKLEAVKTKYYMHQTDCLHLLQQFRNLQTNYYISIIKDQQTQMKQYQEHIQSMNKTAQDYVNATSPSSTGQNRTTSTTTSPGKEMRENNLQ